MTDMVMRHTWVETLMIRCLLMNGLIPIDMKQHSRNEKGTIFIARKKEVQNPNS